MCGSMFRVVFWNKWKNSQQFNRMGLVFFIERVNKWDGFSLQKLTFDVQLTANTDEMLQSNEFLWPLNNERWNPFNYIKYHEFFGAYYKKKKNKKKTHTSRHRHNKWIANDA